MKADKVLITMVVVFLFLIFFGFMFDWGKKERIEKQTKLNRITKCEEAGGIAMLSGWDNKIIQDCVFPMKENQ